MEPAIFNVIRSSDREMLEALKAMHADGDNTPECQEFVFTYLFGEKRPVAADAIASDAELESLAGENVRLFRQVSVETAVGKITIERHAPGNSRMDNTAPFDKVTVDLVGGPAPAPLAFAGLVAFAQKHLGKFSTNALTDYLGEDSKRHFEARDVALTQLEGLVVNLTRDVEDARRRRDAELDEKDKRIDEKYRTKEESLDAKLKEREEELESLKSKLDQREENLNLQAAKGERRQVRQDLKKTFKEWSEQFEITTSTKRLRIIIHVLSVALLALFGTAAGVYLYQSVQVSDTAKFVTVSIKQGVFAMLFVATGIYYARWNTHWFQRRANEEFRLKRMELDFDRASWFVELVFQWQEEFKDQPIPPELIERLTRHLFTPENDDSVPKHPYESIGSALLGASTKLRLGPNGTEFEFDRKGARRLKSDGT